jgi:hypothetical protein
VKISNDPAGDGPGGSFNEFLRLQTEFQARLLEETVSYLRRLQAAAAPSSPGTVVRPAGDEIVEGAGAPGERIELRLEIENRQRVHCMVTPLLSALVSADGVQWSPELELSMPSLLVAPGDVPVLALGVQLPSQLPAGTYRGTLTLQGFRGSALPVAITVGELPVEAKPPEQAQEPEQPQEPAA